MSPPDATQEPSERRALLAAALRRRVAVISDHAWRDRDAAGHLAALRVISGEIERLAPEFSSDPRLQHFLERRSYEKALAWIEGDGASPA